MTALDHLLPLEQSKTASARVGQRLRDLIASGNLRPGEKLPSENELSRAFSVSRPVVREALRGLAMMGIVESRQGGGCFVTDLKPSRLMEPLSFFLELSDYNLQQMFRARLVVDAAVAEDAARKASGEQKQQLLEMVRSGYALAEDPIGFRVMDAEFHHLIAEAAGNAFLQRVSASLYELAMDLRRLATEMEGTLPQSARDHEAIAKAIAEGDAAAASAAMEAHVRHIEATTYRAARAAGRSDGWRLSARRLEAPAVAG
jgi:GntR family transcriptional regulator, transcriptional repressor for pyruvate dehydrogenase complex